MIPDLTEFGPLLLAGIATRTTSDDEASPVTARIPSLWQKYCTEGVAARIPYRKRDGSIFAVYTDYESDHEGEYTLVVGNELDDFDAIPADMRPCVVPHGRYLHFSATGPMPQTLPRAWHEVWEFFENSAHRRTFIADVEIHHGDGVDIYVAVH